MRRFIFFILFISLSLLTAKKITVSNADQLYKALATENSRLDIRLRPGIYDLKPIAVTDSTLGNALDPDSMITVTTGLHLTGKNISLVGKDRTKVIIKTHAGYGIFIEHCPNVLIRNLTITDGARDQDNNATSGAIVIKNSTSEITGCIIENNQGDYSKTIAGIIGIVGREGSHLFIHHNIIHDNSWDGIALYRKAEAMIENNLIYNGRGVGIGMTWDCEAYVNNNVIHHYWKGIGSFGEAWTHVLYNLVRDVRGWGIIASGESYMNCANNETRRCGNVGIACWDSLADMSITRNVICQTGMEKQWIAPLVGIWIQKPGAYSPDITLNYLWDNPQADIAYGLIEPGPDSIAFTFAKSVELFNNYRVKHSQELIAGNYYSAAKLRSRTSYETQPMYPGEVGIFGKDPFNSALVFNHLFADWTWDPDKTPFEKLK